MRKKQPYWLRDFFTLNRSEQRGIVVLLFLIFLLLFFQWLLPQLPHRKATSFGPFQQEVSQFLRRSKALTDSLALQKLQNAGKLTSEQAARQLHPFRFDPNRMTKSQWMALGLTAKQAASLNRYLARGGRFRHPEDLKKMYCLSPAEYALLLPYVYISPDSEKTSVKQMNPSAFHRHKTDINTADTAVIQKNLHLPPWLAARIVKYRTLLGGYYSVEQLREVYGMQPATFKAISHYIRIDTTHLKKIDVNRASFKELLHHPYLDYNTVKKLVNGRRRVHGFRSWHQVLSAMKLPEPKANKIRHYLYLRPLKN
jgi:competence protein ComEA